MSISSFGINNQKTSFKGLIYDQCYDTTYQKQKDYNGKAPDKKITDTMSQFLQVGDDILDIGAGTGRNTIPLATKGYNVTSLELSDVGREIIRKRAKVNHLQDRVEASSLNILNRNTRKQYNAGFMAHVTQHFDEIELNQAMSNIAKSLKKGGVLIYDALVNNYAGIKNSKGTEHAGVSSFNQDYIINCAKDNGFKLVEKSLYQEKGASRSFYVDQKLWGGRSSVFNWAVNKINSDLQKQIPEAIRQHRDVVLKWFIFKKV